MTDFQFKGLLTPVFTPFKDDKYRTVNYDVIDKYGHYLKSRGVEGVVVNGWTGEGTTLSVDEHMKIAEEWVKVARKYVFKVFLVLGGTTLADTYYLAEHAEKIKVDAVFFYPDYFYQKYMTEEDLVKYFKDFYIRMPTRPFFYIYSKEYTKYRFDMFEFLDIIEREIPTFTGIYFDHDVESDEMILLKAYKPKKFFIADTRLSLISPVFEGFDVLSITFTNLYPDIVYKLYDGLKNKRYEEAHKVKDELISYWADWTHNKIYENAHPLYVLKTEFNKLFPEIFLGPMRLPRMTMKHLVY